MSKRSDDGGSSRRRLPLGVVPLAMAAATLLLGFAVAVGAFGGNREPDTGDPEAQGPGRRESRLNTNRQEIGRGDSAFGRYIMYASTGPEGTCAEIELPETDPPGARSFYSDCSREGHPSVNSAEVGDGSRTLVYGLVPDETARVELDRDRGGDLVAMLRSGDGGEGWRFFVASTPEPYLEATIRAIGADGREIATAWLPRAEFTDPCVNPQTPRALRSCTRPAPE
jgi:hypothetical protein